MVYLLSAETKVAAYYLSCLSNQIIDWGTQPAAVTLDGQWLQPYFERTGKSIIELRASKLDSSGKNNEFNLVEGELSDRFGRRETFVPHCDQVCY